MGEQLRILVLDGEPKPGGWLTRWLKQAGYETAVFTDPLDALRAVRKTPCDLIVAAQTLGRMSGIDFVRSAREVLPGVPAILMTDAEDSGILQAAARHGIEHLLPKPVGKDALLPAVESVFRKRAPAPPTESC